jgi:hypothetical protein
MPPNGNIILNVPICILPDFMGISRMPVANSFQRVGTVWREGVHHDTSCFVVFDLFTRVTQMLHLPYIGLAPIALLPFIA